MSGRTTVSTLSKIALRSTSPFDSSFFSFLAGLGVVFGAAFDTAGLADTGLVGVFFAGGGESFFVGTAAGLTFLGVDRVVFGAGFGSRNSSSSSDFMTSTFLFVGVVFGSCLTALAVVFVGVEVDFLAPFVDVVDLAG